MTTTEHLKGKVNLIFPIKGKIEAGYVWLRAGVTQEWKRWYWIGKTETKAGLLGQGFGSNPTYYAKYNLAGHNGYDWPIPEGTCLYAIADGKVFEVNDPIPPSNYNTGYGGFVNLLCEQNGIYFKYLLGHLSDALLKLNDSVRAGDLIALSGNTGDSTGPHTHSTFKETDTSGNTKNHSNGFFGALDEKILYDDILIYKTDDMEKLYQYAKANKISYIGLGGMDNFLLAQKKLGLSGIPFYGRGGYMYFSIRKVIGSA